MRSLRGNIWHTANTTVHTRAEDLCAHLMTTRSLDAKSSSIQFINSAAMQKATERVWKAIAAKETVYIFGDYDCDGITSIAQLLRFFLRHGISPIAYVPHRIRDGYGLQSKHIAGIIESKATLVITVDTGISSAQEVEILQNNGIDVIVTDHHHVPAQIPSAFAIIHPGVVLPESQWKPAGAGVVYNFILALEKNKNWPDKSYDTILAMIGTVGDIVPLIEANRELVIAGLQALHETNNTPVHALLEATNRTGNITSTDIAFGVVPYINAAGRLDEPTIALRALLGQQEHIATIIDLNTQRKKLVESALEEALIHFDAQTSTPYLAWYSDAHLHHGVLGLIASKLTESYGIPSIIATHNTDGTMSASLRSTRQYNIVEGLERIQPLLKRYGGHSQAAGMTCDSVQFSNIISALHTDIVQHSDTTKLAPELYIDTIVHPTMISLDTAEKLRTLEPYGCANESPVFMVKNCVLPELRWVGTSKQHAQCIIHNQKCIAFDAEYLAPHVGKHIDIAFSVHCKEWQGNIQLEAKILDAQLC